MTLRVTSIGIMQTAKTLAVLYGLIGVIVGIAAFFVEVLAPPSSISGPSGIVPGIVGLILIPILYAIAGFIAVAVTVWLYNIVAQRMGGVEFTTANVGTPIA